MKFSIVFGLAALASATIVERDAGPYKAIIDSITSNVVKLDSAVNKYDGSDKKPVVDASNTLVKSINDGKTKIDGMGSIDTSDAIPLSQDLKALNTKSQTLTDDLKKKRGTVAKAGECDTVRKAITDINSSAEGLVNSAVSKIPKAYQNLAQTFVDQFTQTFKDTKDYFSEDNCKNGQSTGPSPSGTGSPTTGAGPTGTSTQSATSASGSSGSSVLNPVGAAGLLLAAFAMYF